MDKFDVAITFSNGEKIIVNRSTIIFPIRLTEHNRERYCSQVEPIVLDEWVHHHDGLIPELLTTFAKNEFFYLSTKDQENKIIYKTSSIVSLEPLQ